MDHATRSLWLRHVVNLLMVLLLAVGGFLAGRLSARADRVEAATTLARLQRDFQRTLEVQERYRLQVEWRKRQSEGMDGSFR
jgi:hypothetical protein